MSILIKGMEMPRDCGHCPFVFFDGQVDEHSWCEAIKPYGINVDKCYETERHKDCPLILVPPHGRLIDADELRGWYDFHSYDVDDDDFLTEEKFDKLMVATAVVRQNIDDAPTIIEAEGEDVNTD